MKGRCQQGGSCGFCHRHHGSQPGTPSETKTGRGQPSPLCLGGTQGEDGPRDANFGAPRKFTIMYLGFEIWVWLKIKQEGLRRCWSMFPLARVPFWVPVF